MRRLILLVGWWTNMALCADPALLEQGKRQEQRSCLPCHSLRLIQSQRLSRAAWNKELDKMAGWGTPMPERGALLEYLVANYGDDKPPAAPERTRDGTATKRRR